MDPTVFDNDDAYLFIVGTHDSELARTVATPVEGESRDGSPGKAWALLGYDDEHGEYCDIRQAPAPGTVPVCLWA